jgi:hypothetical protein
MDESTTADGAAARAARPGAGSPAAPSTLIGIDCATVPANVGLARARHEDGGWRLIDAFVASPARPPATVVAEWLHEDPRALLALDAPLGWPAALGAALAPHRAGAPLAAPIESLFNRVTDRALQARIGKRPLEVGADRIARTAWAALDLLARLRAATRHPIPLAWAPDGVIFPAAIEVYPAGTLIAHGLTTRGYKHPASEARHAIGAWLGTRLELTGHDPTTMAGHALDAVLCVVAGLDFLASAAPGPDDPEVARHEGWIWVRKRSTDA